MRPVTDVSLPLATCKRCTSLRSCTVMLPCTYSSCTPTRACIGRASALLLAVLHGLGVLHVSSSRRLTPLSLRAHRARWDGRARRELRLLLPCTYSSCTPASARGRRASALRLADLLGLGVLHSSARRRLTPLSLLAPRGC